MVKSRRGREERGGRGLAGPDLAATDSVCRDWLGGRGHAVCGRESYGMSIRSRFGLIRTASLGKEL